MPVKIKATTSTDTSNAADAADAATSTARVSLFWMLYFLATIGFFGSIMGYGLCIPS